MGDWPRTDASLRQWRVSRGSGSIHDAVAAFTKVQDIASASVFRLPYSASAAGYGVSQHFRPPRFQVAAGYRVSQYVKLQDMASASTFLQDMASASTRNVLADAISCIDLRFGVAKVLADAISCTGLRSETPEVLAHAISCNRVPVTNLKDAG